MATTITPATQARIEEQERGRHARLLQRASAMRLAYDHDYVSPDGMIVWQPDQQGCCEVVEPGRCSCQEFRVWRSCPHHALLIELTGIEVAA